VEIRVEDNVAMAWNRYVFDVDGRADIATTECRRSNYARRYFSRRILT
jgi:hypothetical protein